MSFHFTQTFPIAPLAHDMLLTLVFQSGIPVFVDFSAFGGCVITKLPVRLESPLPIAILRAACAALELDARWQAFLSAIEARIRFGRQECLPLLLANPKPIRTIRTPQVGLS